jgi:hypothetical protein
MSVPVWNALPVDGYGRSAAQHLHEYAFRAHPEGRVIVSDVPSLQDHQIVVALSHTAVGGQATDVAHFPIGGFDYDFEHFSSCQLTMSAPALLMKS